jgi:predicted nucleic-acid-binding protein
VKLSIDTNVLVRYTTADDPGQAEVARRTIEHADSVCISTAALCEYAWVLRASYHLTREQIGAALRLLLAAKNVVLDAPVVRAGLAVLGAGGDFADGVIAHEGARLGAGEFVTFDRQAAALVSRTGLKTRCLAEPA